MKLILKTLSPLHIGTGNALEPFEYIAENEMFHRLDTSEAFRIAYERHENFPELYSSWIQKTTNEIIQLDNSRNNSGDKNKKLAVLRKNFNFSHFCINQLKDKTLKEEIEKNGLKYTCSMPYGLQDKKQVSECIKTSDSLPYIPGSSIKGFIRTVLMTESFMQFGPNKKLTMLNSALETVRKNDFREIKKLDEKISEEIFCCRNTKFNRGDTERLDLMKFIVISDVSLVDTGRKSSDYMSVLPVNLYLSNNLPQTQTNCYEVVNPGINFSFEIKVKYQELIKVYKQSQTPNAKYWIDFREKFKNLFNLDPATLNNSNAEKLIIDAIFSKINSFIARIKTADGSWLADMERFSSKDTKGKLQFNHISSFISKNLNHANILNIGWGTGFPTKTVFTALQNDPALKHIVEEIFILLKIGVPKSTKSTEFTAPNLKHFPKSKSYYAGAEYTPVFPTGWVAVFPEANDFEYIFNYPEVAGIAVQPPPIEKEEVKTAEEYKEQNTNRKVKKDDIIEAVVTNSESPNIFVEILHPEFSGNLKIRYAAGLKQGTLIKVQITSLRNNKIEGVNFKGFL